MNQTPSQYDPRQQQVPVDPPQKQRRKRRFNWSIVLIPIVVLSIYWIVSKIKPAGSWQDFMDYIDIENQQRFTMVAVLGIVVCCICAVARVLRDHKDD